MKIHDSSQIDSAASSPNTGNVKGTTEPGSISGASAASSAAASSSPDDQVSLSSVSQLLRSSSADRASQLATLSSRIQSGQYQVPSSLLSQSVVSETLARTGPY
jgi:anti-sigma28 factor (negative regulator of flagellin synthesis)